MEKAEIERQLSSTKQELFKEQKNHREDVDSMEEKIETLKIQLNHVTAERDSKSLEIDSVRNKIDKLERQLKEAEKSNLQALIVSKLECLTVNF